MHRLSLILTILALLPSTAAGAEPAARPVAFDSHDGYFVSNRFEPEASTSFTVITDQAAFDKTFGVGRVMGDKSHRLPPAVFEKNMVVAAIHRGKAMVTYQVESMVAEGRTLIVRYTTKSEPSASAEFACPLILSLGKGDYTAVRFVENGRTAKEVAIKPPPPALQIECQHADSLTAETTAANTVLTIKGRGIGRATVTCGQQEWPQVIILRAKLRGLESLTIANDRLEWRASVLSHGNHATLLHLLQDGKEGPPLEKTSPYWVEIQRLDPDGKPATGLPPEGGWFEIRIPRALLENTKTMKLAWIDSYR